MWSTHNPSGTRHSFMENGCGDCQCEFSSIDKDSNRDRGRDRDRDRDSDSDRDTSAITDQIHRHRHRHRHRNRPQKSVVLKTVILETLLWLRMSREEDHAAPKTSYFFIFNTAKETSNNNTIM